MFISNEQIKAWLVSEKISRMLADFSIDLQLSVLSTLIDQVAIKNDLDIEEIWNTMHEASKDVHRFMGDIDD